MSNISIGNKCEDLVCKVLRKHGFFVYRCPKSNSGSQPTDIFAFKGDEEKDVVIMVDAKHVRSNDVSFPMCRIEPNQLASLQYAKVFAGIKFLGFAVLFERDKTLRWLPFEDVERILKENGKSIKESQLLQFEDKIIEISSRLRRG